MRFSGERQVTAGIAEVWDVLHDREVLASTIPGCQAMVPLDRSRYAATMQARVGPVSDTYRGSFTITDLRPGEVLAVDVEARGRCGTLQVGFQVQLADLGARNTMLRYDAQARVRGLAARLGGPAIQVAGSHFTACFFRDLDGALRRRPAQRLATVS
jgi:carbon monoxide dehydrogenase subunit G